MYGSAEGRTQLASSAKFRRLVIVAMHRDQEYEDMQAVQSELSPMVMELAPPGMPANQQVHENNMQLYCFLSCLHSSLMHFLFHTSSGVGAVPVCGRRSGVEGGHWTRPQCFDWRVLCGGCERRGWSPLSQTDLHEQFPAGTVREQTPVHRHRCSYRICCVNMQCFQKN